MVVVEQIDEEEEEKSTMVWVGGEEAVEEAGAMVRVVVCDGESALALLLTPSQLPGEAGELELMEPPY